jgi:hypothetical protein
MTTSIKGAGYSLAATGGAAPAFTLALSPETTLQLAPGAVVLTAVTANGTEPVSLSWAALYADGTSAAALLSGSGSTRTLTTTTYGQAVIVTVTATDSATTPQVVADSAIVAVNYTTDLTLSASPSTTKKATVTGQLLTATPTGGLAPYAYTWAAIFTDGTNANARLSSTTGSTTTLTPTNYRQVFRVICTVTDSSPTTQTATFVASFAVGQPPALVAPPDLVATQLASGTTSSPFTFSAATGGSSPYSYALAVTSSSGAVTLSTSTGLSATLNNLTDGTTGEVTITATDSLGETADGTYIFGVGVAPVYAETGVWSAIESRDLRTLGTGSLSGNGTLTVGGVTFTVVTSAGAPTGKTTTVDASGVTVAQTGVTGDVTTVSVPTNALPNFAACENILVDFLISTQATYLACVASIGDLTSAAAGDSYGVTVNYGATTGTITARRVSSGALTTITMGSIASASKTFAVQVCLFAGRIPLMTILESSTYITGPKLGQTQPMQGTLVACPGAQSLASGATIPTPLSTILVQMTVAGTTIFTVLSYQFSRFTRPPSA